MFFMICKRNFSAGLGHGNSNCEHNPHHPGSGEHRQVGSRQLTGSLKSVTTFFFSGCSLLVFMYMQVIGLSSHLLVVHESCYWIISC